MIHSAVNAALRPGSFFVAPPGRLRIEHAADESLRWEIFQGQLLDAAHTRNEERFAAWHVYLDEPAPAAAPLLSIRWQPEKNKIFVTRQILSRAFEAYEDSPGVILSRPVEKWIAELVGTAGTESVDEDALARELARLLFLAVVGTSRLPITSLETPLPAFSLGRLAYVPAVGDCSAVEPHTDPRAFLAQAIAAGRPIDEQAKSLETALRADDGPTPARLARTLEEHFACDQRGVEALAELLRAVFGGVALSPYTRFADALVSLIVELAEAAWVGPAPAMDVLGYMLRNLCRHLTAFDLTLFHNFGANYPDAPFLEALLAAFLQIASRNPDLVVSPDRAGRVRRRALRGACLVRRHYEGHRVPDAPTSMGDNLRVLPEPFLRVPAEQITDRGKRRRELFAQKTTDDVLGASGRRWLQAGLADLDHPGELREWGMALFLDRPLGAAKTPGEVDRTPLVSYEAFSRSIARRRVRELTGAGWIDTQRRDALTAAIDRLSTAGIPVADLSPVARPGVVSIADAGKAAADFVLLRCTRRPLDELLAGYDLEPLAQLSAETRDWLLHDRGVLFVQHRAPEGTSRPVLRVYRGDQLRLELGFPEDTTAGGPYIEHGGVEWVPLRILTMCDSTGQRDLGQQTHWLSPRAP